MYAFFMFHHRLYILLEFFQNSKGRGKTPWLWSWDYLSASKQTYFLEHMGSKGQMVCLMGHDTLYHKALHMTRRPFLLELFQPPARGPGSVRYSRPGGLTCDIVKHLVKGLPAGVSYLGFVCREVVSCGEGHQSMLQPRWDPTVYN